MNFLETLITFVLFSNILMVLLYFRKHWKFFKHQKQIEKFYSDEISRLVREVNQFDKKSYGTVLILQQLPTLIKTFRFEGVWMTISEYVKLLEKSVEKCQKEMIATSVISGDTWKTGKFNEDYDRYLSVQSAQINRGLKISRYFLIDNQEDLTGNDIDELNKQKKIGIKIYLCSKSKLIEHNKNFYRDFAFFSDGPSSWIVDVGSILSSKEEKWVYVKIIDNIKIVEPTYLSILDTIKNFSKSYD